MRAGDRFDTAGDKSGRSQRRSAVTDCDKQAAACAGRWLSLRPHCARSTAAMDYSCGGTARDSEVRLMRWVRTNRRRGSWLALAAMALQIALSFGHVHLESVRGRLADVTAGQSKAYASPPSPAQHPAGDTDDYCPICAAIHLASTSFLPAAPQLPVPLISRAIAHISQIVAIPIARQRTAFQSRAPPLA
jgi:hypothetical protein